MMKLSARWIGLLAAVPVLAGSWSPACALLVDGATAANASAPADNPGWLNVGDRGVYIGNRWVLTAYHVGVGTTSFPGVGSFAPSGAQFRVKNPAGSGLTEYTDLLMYQLASDPGLPSVPIASAAPAAGAPVMFIGDGNGVTLGTPLTHWQVTGTYPNLTWTEVPSGGNAAGYEPNTTGVKQWGRNLVESDEPLEGAGDPDNTLPINTQEGYGDVISFYAKFDAGNSATSEAHALAYDSGGAVFYKNGATWELAGILDAVSTFANQPSAHGGLIGPTGVFGNMTFAVDLASYRDQITSVPEAAAFWLAGGAAGAMVAWRFCGLVNKKARGV